MPQKFDVLVLNQIAQVGLSRLPTEKYVIGKDVAAPQAILVRSADMHEMKLPESLLAIGRAGAGTNNIPVKAMSVRGVPVFNAPGANANAVKELVIAGMLMAARNLAPALSFTANLSGDDDSIEKAVEGGKKAFAGFELAGQTLGIVGLGKIGSLVADAAIKLGMNVHGFDPEISVDAAWSLPSQVKKASGIDAIMKDCDFVTVHVPLLDATRDLINAKNIALMKKGGVILNFARDGIVSQAAVKEALNSGHLHAYVSDFPGGILQGHPKTIALPHLGASTREAEDNCAVMVVDQVRDYLENGNVRNAVNFPNVEMPRESAHRVAIANSNVPNMLGQISTAMAQAGLNIHNMLNKSRGEMAYTLVDVDSPVPTAAINALHQIEGVLAVRYLPAA